MLAQRLRRWASIKPTLFPRPVLPGPEPDMYYSSIHVQITINPGVVMKPLIQKVFLIAV